MSFFKNQEKSGIIEKKKNLKGVSVDFEKFKIYVFIECLSLRIYQERTHQVY